MNRFLLVVLPPDVPFEGAGMRRHVTAMWTLHFRAPVHLHVPSPVFAIFEPAKEMEACHSLGCRISPQKILNTIVSKLYTAFSTGRVHRVPFYA